VDNFVFVKISIKYDIYQISKIFYSITKKLIIILIFIQKYYYFCFIWNINRILYSQLTFKKATKP